MTENGNGRPLVYTPEEVAKLLKVGRTKVYELIQRGDLRSVKIGKSRRISSRALDEYIERQDQVAAEAAR
jgi:excisionase family DNA binding protein